MKAISIFYGKEYIFAFQSENSLKIITAKTNKKQPDFSGCLSSTSILKDSTKIGLRLGFFSSLRKLKRIDKSFL